MTRYHLTITIFNAFFQGKLNARGKIDSVWFYDYSLFFEKVLQDMDYKDINKFKLNLFQWYKHHLSCIKVCQYVNDGVLDGYPISSPDFNVNGKILDGYSIISQDFQVPSHVIACCIPSRKLRDKYFEYDCLREKYYVKTDFIFYLKK